MTTDFKEELDNNYHNPIWLLEVDADQLQTSFNNHSPGVWYIQLTSFISAPLFGAFWGSQIYNKLIYQVSSVAVTGFDEVVTDYTKRNSISDVQSNAESFYYDQGTTKLYVSFTDYDPWWTFNDVKLFNTIGYSNTGYHNGTVYYQPSIISISPLRRQRDPNFYGIGRSNPVTISLANDEDNKNIDNILDKQYYAKNSRVKLGFVKSDGSYLPFTDFETLYAGKVENIPTVNYDEVEIRLNNNKAFLTRKIPLRVLGDTEYSDISDNKKNKPKPLAFGTIRGAEAICLDKESTDTDHEFIIADCSIWSLNDTGPAVYVDGVLSTYHGYTNTGGTFKIDDTNWNNKRVTVDFDGYQDTDGNLIENSLDIIKEILVNYGDIDSSTDYFDANQWAAQRADAYSIGLYLDSKKQIRDVIQDIAKSNQGMFFESRDGLYTFDKSVFSDTVEEDITKHNIINEPEAQYDEGDWRSSITCLYNRDYSEEEFRREIADSEEASIYQTYGTYQDEEIETYLTKSTEAKEFSENQMDFSRTIRPTFDVELPLKFLETELYDNINIEIDRPTNAWMGNIKTEIIGEQINPNDNTLRYNIRYIEDV